MNIKDFSASLKAKQKELDTLMRRELPIKVGRMAKDHYQDNFRKGAAWRWLSAFWRRLRKPDRTLCIQWNTPRCITGEARHIRP